MEIMHKDDGSKGQFFIEQDGKILAKLTYVWDGNKIIIDHTVVDSSLSGKGIGKQLVRKAVELARDKKIKIIPLCSFAKAVFDKVEDFQDVLN
ncbi:MAG: GNAT family N-acetyltransferase [Candidatus Kapabacteria bacterium]|nr:GNAT family N-acetyltransferase [Candidatus Kapabacteria bacterium]